MPTVAGALPRRATVGYASRRAVLVVMCVGYFLVLLDVTIVNVALPKIGAGLDAGVSGLQWIVDGYALALARSCSRAARWATCAATAGSSSPA
jgi:hypothetical protein